MGGVDIPGYDIGDELGRGSFATVYAARHLALDREVAIKVLAPSLARDERVRERFRGEGRMLASLDHPHIVRVHDLVETSAVCALVMERLHGGTLADRLRVGRLSAAQACAATLAALHGLEHAHQRGVLHRDVKPENLLFGEGDLLKVADFGIAKVVGAQGAQLMMTATAIGTPAFMAPEQVSRALGKLSGATDVWSTGAVLYELLAGEPPFPRDGELTEVLLQRATDAAPRLHDRVPELPPALADVVMRALQRLPGERYARAGAFAAALEAASDGDALAATGIPIHRTPAVASSAQPTLLESVELPLIDAAARSESPAPQRSRARLGGRALGATAGALVVVVGALVLLLGGGGDRHHRAAARVSASSLPAAPAGWPHTMAVGLTDPVGGDRGVARHGGALTTFYLGGDAAAKQDWSADPTTNLGGFVHDAYAAHVVPYIGYYQIRALGQSRTGDDADAAGLRRTLTDPRLMRIYWGNVRKLMQELGRTGRPVALSVESGFWALLEAQLTLTGGDPADVRALVGSSGAPELSGLPDTLPGFASGWQRLRDRYAPRVLLGYILDEWGETIDISRALPAHGELLADARRSAAFYLNVTTAGTSHPWDFVAYEVAYAEEGRTPDAQDRFSDAEKQGVVDYLRQFDDVAQTPVVLEGVPLGNTVSRAIDDKPFHWHSTWMQWLLGDGRFARLRALRDAGAIGMTGGFGADRTATCACDAAHDGVTNAGVRGTRSTSSDDDGGYLAGRLAALRRAGGLPLGG